MCGLCCTRLGGWPPVRAGQDAVSRGFWVTGSGDRDPLIGEQLSSVARDDAATVLEDMNL